MTLGNGGHFNEKNCFNFVHFSPKLIGFKLVILTKHDRNIAEGKDNVFWENDLDLRKWPF